MRAETVKLGESESLKLCELGGRFKAKLFEWGDAHAISWNVSSGDLKSAPFRDVCAEPLRCFGL